jgi:glycosyltransferase involved in cell wall biosynthesis
MKICHITPHLPPDQAANALLPYQLGLWAREAGDEVTYVAHPARAGRSAEMAGPVTWMPRRDREGALARLSRAGAVAAALRIMREAGPSIAEADLVHVHSNGLLAEVAGALAVRARKPVVLTLYGTEIWHYRRRRPLDLFTRLYRQASAVTFYSHGLAARAQQLGLARHGMAVIYPPVAPEFRRHDTEEQAAAREALGLRNRHLLLNVKRLHPLAGQRFLIEAMGEVIRVHPDSRLVICGTGPLLPELQAAARSAGVEGHVTFAGLLDNATVARYCAAADVFVLPSLLEACPTVALEALASGTPVISSDNPGGVELNDAFGVDVGIVPRENALALARALTFFLEHKRRTHASTDALLEHEFRAPAVASQYRAVYERALRSAAAGSAAAESLAG